MFRALPLFTALALLAGAAHAQEREWTLDASEEDAYLIFGVPDTDDVGVSLWCPLGKGAVHLYVPVPTSQVPKGTDKTMPLIVTAGPETVTFRAKLDSNPQSVTSSAEAEIALDHPLVTALGKADRFSVTAGDHEIVYPLFDADIEGLLALCKKG